MPKKWHLLEYAHLKPLFLFWGVIVVRKEQLTLSSEIAISGFPTDIERAKKALAPVLQPKLKAKLTDAKVRVAIQDIIDENKLSASIMYKGHRIWSRRKILRNLNRIITLKRLANGKPVLSNYFYAFIIDVCGSNPHHDRKSWIEKYPTFESFKSFFLKNEHDQTVMDYIPEWKGDSRRILADIERKLLPFHSYLRSKRKPK